MATKLNKTAKKQKAHTRKDTSCMEIIGGRVHNLKNVNLRLPHGKLIVVTGVSGSGKSSLIFHLLYAEAHRRYLSTLESTFVQNMVHTLAKPDVDKISGLQAVVGIGQELTRSNSPRSTVGTLTDIYTFLRLLYARVADAYSPTTGKKMVCQTEREIQDHILSHFENKEVAFMAPIASGRRGGYKMLFAQLYKNGFTHVIVNDEEVKIYPNMELHRYHAHDIKLIVASNVHITKENISKIAKYTQETLSYGKGCLAILAPDAKPHYYSRFLMDDAMMGTAYRKPTANTFSFNSPYGACPRCQGLGIVNEIDQAKLIPDPRLSIAYGGIPLLGSYKPTSVFKRIESFLNGHGYNLRTPIQDIEADVMSALLYGRDPQTQKKVKINLGQVLGKRNKTRDSQEVHAVQVITCPLCEGKRLHKEALHFKIHGKDITEVSQMSLEDLAVWLKELPHQFSARQAKIASELLGEINKRVKLLLDMRLHYLSLNRPLYTLSGGEIRRSRIASHIGTQDAHLVGVLYILDEPTMNLHMRDIHNLIAGLRKLKNLGNSIVLSEHNKAMMLAADYLVELGPGAGQHGGTIVATGPPKKFLSQKSVTGDFLNEKETIGTLAKYRKKKGKSIVLRGCTGNNLKNVTLTIPLGKLIAVTGVSGSGKSTLLHRTLFPALKNHLDQVHKPPLPYQSLEGMQHINKVIEVTQTPLGRNQRSNVATYIQLFDLIRELFAMLPQAKIRGYKPQRFSFNNKGGRCEDCKGTGSQLIEMDFMPSVRIPCNICKGRFYNRETLEVQYKGKSIADVLAMTVEEALVFFDHHPKIKARLMALDTVNLGYIKLGQHATTLSGGEAQRIKLASELVKRQDGNTFYILDELNGLHFQDLQRLVAVLQKFVDQGNTIICIEHNIDLIKICDHVIDLGPEAGNDGGYIVAQGTPQEVAQNPRSHTGAFLKKELAHHANNAL